MQKIRLYVVFSLTNKKIGDKMLKGHMNKNRAEMIVSSYFLDLNLHIMEG